MTFSTNGPTYKLFNFTTHHLIHLEIIGIAFAKRSLRIFLFPFQISVSTLLYNSQDQGKCQWLKRARKSHRKRAQVPSTEPELRNNLHPYRNCEQKSSFISPSIVIWNTNPAWLCCIYCNRDLVLHFQKRIIFFVGLKPSLYANLRYIAHRSTGKKQLLNMSIDTIKRKEARIAWRVHCSWLCRVASARTEGLWRDCTQ